jgi:hypothetical protein
MWTERPAYELRGKNVQRVWNTSCYQNNRIVVVTFGPGAVIEWRNGQFCSSLQRHKATDQAVGTGNLKMCSYYSCRSLRAARRLLAVGQSTFFNPLFSKKIFRQTHCQPRQKPEEGMMSKHVSSLQVENTSIKGQLFIETINIIWKQLSWRTSAWKRRWPDATNYFLPSFFSSSLSLFNYFFDSFHPSVNPIFLPASVISYSFFCTVTCEPVESNGRNHRTVSRCFLWGLCRGVISRTILQFS